MNRLSQEKRERGNIFFPPTDAHLCLSFHTSPVLTVVKATQNQRQRNLLQVLKIAAWMPKDITQKLYSIVLQLV